MAEQGADCTVPFGRKRKLVPGGGENCIIISFVICTPHQIFLRLSMKESTSNTDWPSDANGGDKSIQSYSKDT